MWDDGWDAGKWERVPGLGVNTYRCSGVRAVETISHEGEDLAEMRREVRKQVNKQIK